MAFEETKPGSFDLATRENYMTSRPREHTRRVFLTLGISAFFMLSIAKGADVTVQSIISSPKSFDNQIVSVRGTAAAVRELTSARGNDYTTFKLQDVLGDAAVNVFIWGHPALRNGEQVSVNGVFEIVHRQGQYTFYNEIEATTVDPLSH